MLLWKKVLYFFLLFIELINQSAKSRFNTSIPREYCDLFQWFQSVSIINWTQDTMETTCFYLTFPCFLKDMNETYCFTFPSSLIQTTLTAKNIVIATGGRPNYPTNVSNTSVILPPTCFSVFSASMWCLVDWLPDRQNKWERYPTATETPKLLKKWRMWFGSITPWHTYKP